MSEAQGLADGRHKRPESDRATPRKWLLRNRGTLPSGKAQSQPPEKIAGKAVNLTARQHHGQFWPRGSRTNEKPPYGQI